MFHDSMVALMVMLLLCFFGMLVMFLFVIRSHSVMTATLKEGQRQQQLALSDIERQLMDISFQFREGRGKGTTVPPEDLASLLENIGKANFAAPMGNGAPSSLHPEFATGFDAGRDKGFSANQDVRDAAYEAARVVAGSPNSLSLPDLDTGLGPASDKGTSLNRLAMGR